MSPPAAPDAALASELLAVLERVAPRPLSIPELARRLELGHYDHRGLQRLPEAEVAARRLRRIGKTRYQWLRPVEVAAPARAAAAPPAATARRARQQPATEHLRRSPQQ